MCKQMTETELIEPNVWAQRLISLLLVLLGISFAGILILGSYYDQPITQSLSFKVQDAERFDGKFDSGLGLHSFGDFQELRYALPTADYPDFWTNSDSAYPPTALIPNAIAKWTQRYLGIETALYGFLFLAAIGVATPAIHTFRRVSDNRIRLASFLVLSIFAQPLIASFDRGNSIGFAVPFLMLFGISYFDRSHWSAVVGLLGAFAVRPQFALLGIALVIAKEFKKSATALLFGALIFFGSFLFMPGEYSESFESWLENLKGFTQKYDQGGPFPVNLSMKTAFNGFLDNSDYILAAGILIALVIAIFSLFMAENSRGRVLIAVLILPCLLPALSFGYYSVFVLVIAAMIFTEPKFLEPPSKNYGQNTRRQIKTRVAYNYLLITVVAISLAPIPFVREVGRNSIALESFSALWTIVLIATLAQQIVEHYNAKVAA
jgi:hypothetical protein